METSALYGLAGLLGHKACTICAIIANRYVKEYSKDYHKTVDLLIGQLLDRLTA
jgi:uridine phosphorylase